MHPRRFARRFGSESERTSYSCSETFGLFYALGRLHPCFSNKTGDAPELSYIAHESAMGR